MHLANGARSMLADVPCLDVYGIFEPTVPYGSARLGLGLCMLEEELLRGVKTTSRNKAIPQINAPAMIIERCSDGDVATSRYTD